MFKYIFGIKTTFLQSLRSRKIHLKARFCKTSYKEVDFARGEFLRLVGAPNGTLKLIIIYYMFKYTSGIKTTLLESLRGQESHLKAQFRQNWL